VALLLVAWLGLLLPESAPATSLRFFGNGQGAIDRVTIQIDNPARPADVGSTDFTLEWWMRADDGDNASEAVACDANDGWIFGNILFDRDVYGAGAHGDYGVSLTGGRVAFGVSAGAVGNTICGATVVADGVWHHVAVTRQKSNGRLRIYVDGVLDAEGDGNVGSNADVSYQNGLVTGHEWDPYLVIGAEKHDADPSTYPSYRGWIDEIRLSTTQRYTDARFTRPFSPFSSDGCTAALYHLDEGTGDTIGDASGGGSSGRRRVGGDPEGPEWSSETAPLGSARRVALEEVVTGAGRTVAIANAGDGRLFVVDANGRILAYQVTEEGHFTLLGVYLDIQDRVLCCNERGLLGLAFHPSYATNQYFFVYYTREPDGDVVIARYRAPTAGSNSVDPATERILLTIEHSTFGNHNGGGLAFGPDGYLYASVGDGGGGGDQLHSGQSLATHLGKILRFAVDVSNGGGSPPYYSIPPDNPFVSTAGAMDEIWAWGLRNPWRIGFDRLTGDLFIADVGQDNREEVNFQLAGSVGGVNYGWPRMEGNACYSPVSGCQTGSLVLPILDYSHGEGCSITGGYRYRGTAIPALHGAYVFGDFCSKKIWAGVQAGSGTWSRIELLSTNLSITTFGEDNDGELYVGSVGGAVHRFVGVPPRLTVTKAGSGTGTVTGPDGLACGASCSVQYEPGQMVTLTASPGATSWLAGWSGGCGGTGTASCRRTATARYGTFVSARCSVQRAEFLGQRGNGAATIRCSASARPPGRPVDYAISGNRGGHRRPQRSRRPLTGTLTFTPGQSSRTFTVPVVNDGQIEGPETILLSLHHPSAGGVLGTPLTAVLTIVDNDVAGTLQFSPATLSVSEAAGPAVLTVTRNQKSTGVTVNWAVVAEGTTAVLNTDYGGPTSGQLDFGGDLSRTIAIPLLNPPGFQGSRTLRVQLSNPSSGATLGTQKTATLTITDDEIGLQFSQPTYTASEGSTSITIPVVRTGPGGAVSVAFAAGPPGSGVAATASAALDSCNPGADYVPLSGTLNFGPSDMSKTFTIKLCKDGLFEATPKVVGLTLTSPQPSGVAHLGPHATADLAINNVDQGGTLKWSAATYSVNEASPKVVLTVNRTGGSAGNVTVGYVIAGVTATADADFGGPLPSGNLTGTLQFGAGVMSRTLEVPILQDSNVESNETFTVTLQNAQGGASVGIPSLATVTIVDDDRAGTIQFSQATATAQEDTSVTLTVTRTGSTSQGASVGYAITGDTASVNQAVTPLAGTVTFLSGQGSRPLPIKLSPDSNVDGNSTLTVTLQTPSLGLALGTPNPATVTLIDNEGTVQFGATTFTVSESNDLATITLTRTGGTSQPTTVHFATGGPGDTATPAATPGACSAGADYRPILDGSLTFSPGQTTRTFTVPLCRDTVVESPNPETLTLRLLSATAPATLGAQSTAALQIVENDAGGVLRFSSASYSVTEGTPTATLTVLRANGAAGNVTVPWSLGGNAVLNTDYGGPTSGQLAFGPSQTSASLSIPILNDALLDGVKNVVVTLGAPTGVAALGSPSVATLGINDNEPSVRFSNATYNVSESSTSVGVTVIRGGSTGSTVTVNVKTTGTGTAEGGPSPCGPGIDFTTATLPVTFSPGQTSKSVTIPLCPDTEVDGLETIGLALDNVVGATLGTPNTATIQIAENDVAGAAQPPPPRAA
jgi:glucose/arabinose dehydrogenase